MSNAVYFIEKDGVIYYKADTFWSTTKNIEHAKIHQDSKYDQDRFLKSYLYGLDRDIEEGNSAKIINSYKPQDIIIYGYRLINLNLNLNSFSEPIYLKVIDNITSSGYEIYDYKVKLRNDKINEIMNNMK